MTQSSNLRSGAQILVDQLRIHGVDTAFCVPGESYLATLDALYDVKENLKLVICRQEGGVTYMGDAYGKATGKPGVCFVTRGPGATNASLGVHTAHQDSTPLILFIGQVGRAMMQREAFQEVDFRQMYAPLCKWVAQINDPARIPEMVARAFHVATSGRPGPVVLDVPEDICHEEYSFTPDDFWVDPATTCIPARRIRPASDDVARAAALLAKAKRPLILAGGGIHLSEAWDSLTNFAESFNVPVAHTMSGKGSISCASELNAGLFGRYSRIANDLIESSDCLLAVGCKLGEIATKRYDLLPGNVPLIHLDVLEEELGRTTRAEVALWGDAAVGLDDIAAELADSATAQKAARAGYVAEVPARMQKWTDEAADRLLSKEKPIDMRRVMQELNNYMPADSVLVADGGFAGVADAFALLAAVARSVGSLPREAHAASSRSLRPELVIRYAASEMMA